MLDTTHHNDEKAEAKKLHQVFCLCGPPRTGLNLRRSLWVNHTGQSTTSTTRVASLPEKGTVRA